MICWLLLLPPQANSNATMKLSFLQRLDSVFHLRALCPWQDWLATGLCQHVTHCHPENWSELPDKGLNALVRVKTIKFTQFILDHSNTGFQHLPICTHQNPSNPDLAKRSFSPALTAWLIEQVPESGILLWPSMGPWKTDQVPPLYQ